MRLVLFGDIHFYRLWFAPWHLLSKRLLGQANLLFNRRKVFRHELFDELVNKAAALNPDKLLLSGDLTTTAMASEFLDAAKALRPLTDHVPTVMVPGNHDRYTYSSHRNRQADRLLEHICPPAFPYTEKLTEHWHLLGLDAGVPRAWFDARGSLGVTQLDGVRQFLNTLEKGEGVIVLCHYPCALPLEVDEKPSHALDEKEELRNMLANCPARVVYMHGHIHQPWYHEPGDGSGVPFTCIDAGAPCMTSAEYPLGQGFYEIELGESPDEPIVVKHHTLSEDEVASA